MQTQRETSLNLSSSPIYTRSLLVLAITITITLLLSINVFTLKLWQILPYFLVGLVTWSVTEYLLNRFTLHKYERKGYFGLLARYHKKHHIFPKNLQFIMMPPSVILILSVLLSLAVLAIGGLSFLPFLGGFLSGYLLFILIHTAVHYYAITPKSILRPIWANHLLHHAKYPNTAYGVTSPVWDLAFKTTPPKSKFFTINPEVLSYYSSEKFKATEVTDDETEQAFLSVPQIIHQDNRFFIPQIQGEITDTFNPEKNSKFKQGVARRWVLTDRYGAIIGRIAAFIDFQKMYEGDKKVGGIGFFECINDKNAAFYLFDIATNWLQSYYQVKAVNGPINFGENDKFWGLLVEGFNSPSYGMNYNPPYYKELFEEYGFKEQYQQITNRLHLKKPLPERFYKIASRVKSNSRYTFKPFSYKKKEAFVKDFVDIYNQAWASFKDFHPLDADYVRKSLEEIKPVMEEKFIWFAYVDGKPAGLLVGMPDVNELIKYTNGKMDLLNKIKFISLKYLKGFTVARVVIMGVVPQYQRMGLESALILNAYNSGKELPGYNFVELAWVGDFNDKMIAIHNAMGAVPDKKHATYRKELG